MNPLMLPVAVALAGCGVTLLVYGRFVSRHGQWKPVTAPSQLSRFVADARGRFGSVNPRVLLLAVVATVAYFLLTRWMAALVVVPVLIIMVPKLLLPKDRGVQLLDEIVAWLGILVGRVKGGAHLENVIRSSYLSAGEGLKPALRRLIARLNASESTERALDAFAQDLADPTIDQVVYLLKISARERGAGLSESLKDIEQKIRSEIEVRRKITATQGSARQTVLLLNLIIFSAVLIMAPQAAAYRTGAGQLVFLILFGVLIGVMMIIRRTVALRPIPRILGDTSFTTSQASRPVQQRRSVTPVAGGSRR